MLASLRAGLTAALLLVSSLSALSADKPYHRDDLAEAATRVEGQIKADAGTVAKPLAALRRDADAAVARRNQDGALDALGKIAAVAPADASNWLRLARTILQTRPADESGTRRDARARRRRGLHRLSAHRQPQRGGRSLAVLGRALRRPQAMACGARHAAPVARHCARSPTCAGSTSGCAIEHGFRYLDYTVDSDSVSPRACFQFSENLPGRRTDFSPFVAIAGMDKPAISSQRQAALRRGPQARRTLHHHAARRPAVDGARDAGEVGRITIFVRDRKPSARFSGKAYVLPRTGQRGIPVLSVNTAAVTMKIYRDRRPQSASKPCSATTSSAICASTSSSASATSAASRSGAANSRSSSRSTPRSPRHSRSTRRVGHIGPGVYVMAAERRRARRATTTNTRDPMVHRLRPRPHRFLGAGRHPRLHQFARERGGDASRQRAPDGPQQRGARRPSAPMPTASRLFEPAWRAARAAWRRPLVVATDQAATTPSSSLKSPAFDLSATAASAGPSRRPASMPSSTPSAASIAPARPSHVTALLRDARGAPRPTCR